MNTPEKPTGPYHDFWLLETEKYPYECYWDFLPREDAPVRMSDDLYWYFNDTFEWLETSSVEGASWRGLNPYGPTIVNQVGGRLFAELSQKWADLLKLEPEEL